MKRLTRSLAALACAMLAIAFLATTAKADDDKDPPGRVARLSYMNGQVSFQPGGVNDWVDATLNRPLTTTDRVWTDKDSKAELTLGTAAIRMSSETSLTISNLNDSTVQLELDQGVLNLHVRKMYAGEVYEVDTPNVAFTLLKPGDYRFEVNPDRDTTEVIVRKGKGEGNGNGRGVQVNSGEMARFEHGNTLMHVIAAAPPPDGFDDWCRVRIQRENKSYESARYVSDDMVGYEDLDEYGSWRPVPTYGYVWVPRRVSYGWAPYRYGHWAWIYPWGWTWVDDAPWGFAPFHYGRWVYGGWGWGWCPGPRVYRPVYAPALVGWFGGAGWGIGVGFGNVGWVPLGWGEPYYPYYRVSRNYVRNVNISNTHITNITYVTNNYNTIINNHGKPQPVHYMNGRAANVMASDAMVHARPVDRYSRPLDHKDWNKAEFMHGPGVVPDRQSVLGGEKTARAPQNMSDRKPVWSKMTPEHPVSFEERRAAMVRNNGGTVDRNAESPRGQVPDQRAGEGHNGPRESRPESTNASDNRSPSDHQPASERGGNANAESGPAVPQPPSERRPVGVNVDARGNRNASNDAPQHAVPRPPSDRNPGAGVSDTPTNREASNDNPRHVVPRPPAERRPVGGNQERVVGADLTPGHATPQVPDERRQATSNRDASNTRTSAPQDSNAREARPTVPSERSARPGGGQGRSVDAEARPQSAPKPPERESKPPSSQKSEERRSAPAKNEAPKSKPAEHQPKSDSSPAGTMARADGSRYYVPRPTASNPSHPAYQTANYSNSTRDGNSYRARSYTDRGYARDSYRSNSNVRDFGYSGRTSAGSGRESQSIYRAPSSYRAAAPSYGGRSYSGGREGYSQPSYRGNQARGGSYGGGSSRSAPSVSRSSGGSYSRGGGGERSRGH